jgi:hypothetical protein
MRTPGVDELYVLARRVLLDALVALGEHRGAAILAGAQAIYLRVGEGDLAVAPYTTDGDLAIDPAILPIAPPLERGLLAAGFIPRSHDSVGEWVTSRTARDGGRVDVAVDLLVPPSVSPGKGRRAAHLPGHDARAVRIVRGLDGVLVDRDLMVVGSLETGDDRSFPIQVAGPAALLIAKLHKIQDRQGTSRQGDKDALDIFRLLRGISIEELAERIQRVRSEAASRVAAETAAKCLSSQFGDLRGAGVAMLLRAIGPLADPDEVSASCVALTSDLLHAIRE